MLASKTFLKKTKKGSVLKVVREHYLRDDVWCGVEGCMVCKQRESTTLEARPTIKSDLCPQAHFILPDTNVVLHQIDFLEDPAVRNVILLQIVLQEVKNQNLSAYKRIRDLISNPAKKFYVFANEHHRETFVEREESNESSNDRNDRAIRVASKWYNQHLVEALRNKDPPKVILLTNDRENLDKAKLMDLDVYTIHDYASSLTDHPSLVDRLAKCSFENDSKSKERTIYPEHLALSVIQSGLKNGTYLQSVFQGSRENYLEGFVFS